MIQRIRFLALVAAGLAAGVLCASPRSEQAGGQRANAGVTFRKEPGKVAVLIGGQPFATYHFKDPVITRPFLANVQTPGGVQVTRNFPLTPGDLQDHATFHPGISLAFGDMNGHDFWRVKSPVVHDKFLEEPVGGPDKGSFAVRNLYLPAKGAKPIGVEECRLSFHVRPAGYLIVWTSRFSSAAGPLVFGDQEEMGLGVRVATPLAVVKGGRIHDSEGRVNEKQVWGKTADWCDYSGSLAGKSVGLTVMPDPNNFRKSWFHARDYGLLAANPFGRHALTGGSKSRVTVNRGETLTLLFGILVHAHSKPDEYDPRSAYKDFLRVIDSKRN